MPRAPLLPRAAPLPHQSSLLRPPSRRSLLPYILHYHRPATRTPLRRVRRYRHRERVGLEQQRRKAARTTGVTTMVIGRVSYMSSAKRALFYHTTPKRAHHAPPSHRGPCQCALQTHAKARHLPHQTRALSCPLRRYTGHRARRAGNKHSQYGRHTCALVRHLSHHRRTLFDQLNQ